MNKKPMVLFDIDRTLFNSDLFLESFYSNLYSAYKLPSDYLSILKLLYQEVKKRHGHFVPDDFLKELAKKFELDAKEVEEMFWDEKQFDRHVYNDIKILKVISEIADLGIFSTGDSRYQKQKILSIKHLIDNNNIHIYSDKLGQLENVLRNLSGQKVYLVDDYENILIRAKEINRNVFTVLMDRRNLSKDSNEDEIDLRIENLDDLPFLIKN